MRNQVASARVFYVLRDLRAEFGLRPVTVSSPRSPDECLRRLAEVTTVHGATWYLKPETAVLCDPQLRGNVSPRGIHVALFRDSMGRNNFLPWLDARFESAPSGGTTLAGTIGPQPGSAGLIAALAMISVFMAAVGIIAGTAALAATGSPRALPVLLVPLGINIIEIIIVIGNRRTLPQHISALVQEVNDILDSASTV